MLVDRGSMSSSPGQSYPKPFSASDLLPRYSIGVDKTLDGLKIETYMHILAVNCCCGRHLDVLGLRSACGARDQLLELHLDHDRTFEEIIAGSPGRGFSSSFRRFSTMFDPFRAVFRVREELKAQIQLLQRGLLEARAELAKLERGGVRGPRGFGRVSGACRARFGGSSRVSWCFSMRRRRPSGPEARRRCSRWPC